MFRGVYCAKLFVVHYHDKNYDDNDYYYHYYHHYYLFKLDSTQFEVPLEPAAVQAQFLQETVELTQLRYTSMQPEAMSAPSSQLLTLHCGERADASSNGGGRNLDQRAGFERRNVAVAFTQQQHLSVDFFPCRATKEEVVAVGVNAA